MALAGADGKQAAELLRTSVKHGAAVLGTLTEAAVKRLLSEPAKAKSAKRLFTDDERDELADALAAVTATANLLGRARIRKRLEQAEKQHGDNRTAQHHSEQDGLRRGVRVASASRVCPDSPTDFSCFDDANRIHPLAPLRALDWFRKLIPGLNVPAASFAKDHERQGFTLAATTDETLLGRIQGILARVLATGEQVRATPKVIDGILDDAGIAPKNPQYAEMVFRTNAMSAYNRGSHEEMQDPDVKDSFPVWRYEGIRDGRQGKDHEKHFGKYYPNSANFEEVRGNRPYNCRCTSIPIYKSTWKRLQAQGASVAKFAEEFCDPGTPEAKPGPCPEGAGVSTESTATGTSKTATVAEANAWQEKHYGEWTNTVPQEQRRAAESYSGNMYRSVNGLLRDPGNPSHRMNKVRAESITKAMDAMLDSAPGLPEDTTLYRGVFGDFADTIRGLRPGDEIHDKGFVSTTPAESHSRENFLKDNGALIQIHAPKGAKALPMYRFSPKQEGEMVLPRNSRFRVREIKDGVVHMELLA